MIALMISDLVTSVSSVVSTVTFYIFLFFTDADYVEPFQRLVVYTFIN